MLEFYIALGSAFWLGVLTSISPCPLATNIAAISFVGRRVAKPGSVFAAGLLYTVGRMLVYTVLGVILVSSMLSAPVVALALQKYMNIVLGPLLIVVGMIMLQLITFNSGGSGVSQRLQNKVESMGVWGAFLLGVIFALSFCPLSAALFFASLLPLAIQQQSSILMPAVYGIATGLPVLLFAVILASGANRLGKAYNKIVVFEKIARNITGVLFIGVGIYYSLAYIFGVSFW
ncbi:MAG: sulfite exporter TauE/SafE family protein [Akkermansiaceae bacterium]|nr:sulfite exporter TauE/SafE family protein [Akkermansiaceae bacterium]